MRLGFHPPDPAVMLVSTLAAGMMCLVLGKWLDLFDPARLFLLALVFNFLSSSGLRLFGHPYVWLHRLVLVSAALLTATLIL